VRGPLDGTSRRLLARLARAEAGEDAHAVAEQVRADLSAWPCLGEELHHRFHRRLAEEARR
jgi:hypothetical protein